jgi:hypothetical protein
MFRHLSTFDTGQGVDLVAPLFRAGTLCAALMETTRHKSVDVLPGYVRRVDLFTVRTMRGRRSYDAGRPVMA